jgi:hemoglobin-like flavoprotein
VQADADAGRCGQLGNLEAVLPAASALAKRHVEYGVKPADYTSDGAVLLWTLEQGLGLG